MARRPLTSPGRRLLGAFAILIGASSPLPATAQGSDAAYTLATHLGAAMEKCWFAGGDRDFGNYVYSPEPNATGGPRILVVPRASPGERPVLVIQVTTQGGKPHVDVYGPLASTLSSRIGTDLRRWMGGSDACG